MRYRVRMARILIPLPDTDFDTTEVAVPWRVLTDAGHAVMFATETGNVAACDPRLLSGVVFGKLGADESAKECYRQASRSSEFLRPLPWPGLVATDFDALLLPGGHAPGMRQYLGSESLQRLVAEFAALDRPIAAICHGVLVLARATHACSGLSVLHGRRTTCLPRYMEAFAFGLSFWKLGRYYRTYPAYVESEVRAALAAPADFERGPITLGDRGTADDDAAAFVVEDGNYISARWPGDAWLLSRRLVVRLKALRAKAAA